MLQLRTINDVFTQLAKRGGETVMMTQNGDGWTPLTAKQVYGRVRALAEALQSWGVVKGDRVAMTGENRWEWPVTDFAILAIGAVSVPLYQTLSPEQVGYSINDSGSKVFICSTGKQYEKLHGAGEMPKLERVLVWDAGEFPNTESWAEVMKRAPSLEEPDAAFDAMVAAAAPGDLATIVYTSGTTGQPKGVMLTHGNVGSNMMFSTDDLHIVKDDVSISFLPLSHALARHLDYVIYANGGIIAYEPKFDNLTKSMKSVRPTVFVAVPRVFEKVRQAVEGRSHGFKKTILQWALKQGEGHRDELAAGKQPSGLMYKLADKLVFSKIHEAFGGRAKVFISGGAPLGMESSQWFLNVGVRVMEGYGLTETSPVISRNTFAGYRMGTVGTILPNVETRIASDGELEVKGPNVFSGYWQKPDETKKEFTDDGWFKTGDIGKIEDGFLSITDRKKELMKTSGGKYVAPQPIESKLKVDGLVNQVALIGDNRKFVSAIFAPNFQALEKWASANGVASGDHAKMVADPKVQKVYQDIADKANAGLEHHETIKKVIVTPDDWTVESGELTPSLKLKRRVISEKYKEQIDTLYAE